MQQFTHWIKDWERKDHLRYISHDSKTDFRSRNKDFKAWDRHKRKVNINKKYISVEYNNLNIFKYPGEDNLVTMQYDQSYHSSNLNVASAKELFWKLQDNQWKIVYEGSNKY
jgi:hypothetical protein